MLIVPKNWQEFQHYKDRSPPWIKLHRNILDNRDFHKLPVASRALAPMLWLLASEHDDGHINAAPEEIAFRLRMSESSAKDALKPLIDSGFFSVVSGDSGVLARSKRNACLETEGEKRQSRDRHAHNFEIFWKAYPKKKAKGHAEKAFASADVPLETLLSALKAQCATEDWRKDDGRYIPYPATWLNSKSWLDCLEVGELKDWRETRSGIESRAQQLGIGPWDQMREQWPSYLRRVEQAHQEGEGA